MLSARLPLERALYLERDAVKTTTVKWRTSIQEHNRFLAAYQRLCLRRRHKHHAALQRKAPGNADNIEDAEAGHGQLPPPHPLALLEAATDAYLPASQSVQAVAPATEILPAGQSVQTVEPAAAAYFPALQLAQLYSNSD